VRTRGAGEGGGCVWGVGARSLEGWVLELKACPGGR